MNSFQPKNELEQRLVAAQEGTLSSEDFMKRLMDAQIFMPVKDSGAGVSIGGFQANTKAVPLTLHTDEQQEVLILFTSPERAKEFLQDFPDYQGGLLVEFHWVLERTGSGVAIGLNPDSDFGIDLDTDTVQQLRHWREQ